MLILFFISLLIILCMVVDEILTTVNHNNEIEHIKVNDTYPVLYLNITNKKVYYLNI